MIDLKYEESFYIHDGNRYYQSSFKPEWIKELLGKNPNTIFEFGSFDGGDGLKYKLYYPNTEVYSFEPFLPLYENVKKIEKYGIKTFNLAFYNTIGAMPFYSAQDKNTQEYYGIGGSLEITVKDKEPLNHYIQFASEPLFVPCTTIEKFCADYCINTIDFMHIDVEGAVMEVLQGLGGINPKIIFAEVRGCENGRIGAIASTEVNKFLFDRKYELIAENYADSLFLLKE